MYLWAADFYKFLFFDKEIFTNFSAFINSPIFHTDKTKQEISFFSLPFLKRPSAENSFSMFHISARKTSDSVQDAHRLITYGK